MNSGKIKFFKADKGYGFIIPDKPNSGDVFFHTSQVKFPVEELKMDKRVVYEIVEGRKGQEAADVCLE